MRASTQGALLQRLRLGVEAFGSSGWQRPGTVYSSSALFSSTAVENPYYNVPAGHQNSDLSGAMCNIGLGRRRDLTMRQDLRLFQDGKGQTLAEVFKGKKVFLVGFPGGKVCTQEHLPGFAEAEAEMRRLGVSKVVALTHSDDGKVDEDLVAAMAAKSKFIEMYADKGGFCQLLGTEWVPPPTSTSKARCQRFAALVEDGILLKLNVEKQLGDCEMTNAKSLMEVWKIFYP